MAAATDTQQANVVWVMCGICWGQRRIFEDRNGEGLVPCTCPACLGIGELAVARD